MAYMYKYAASGVPIKMLYVHQNNSAELFPARDQIGGVFIQAVKRGKVILTAIKRGYPLEVVMGGVKRERWYVVVEGAPETVVVRPDNPKEKVRGKPTDDLVEKGNVQNKESGIKYETISEAINTVRMLLNAQYEANQDKIKNFVIPFIAGGGVVGSILLLVVLLMQGGGG